MLAASAAERACFALIPIGIVSMSIGIGAKSIGIRAKSTGIGVFPIGTGAIPIGIRAIPIDFGPVPIENAPVPIGIGAKQTRFPAAAAGFQSEQSGSAAHYAAFRLAAKTKAAREGGWLQFLQKFKTEKSSKSSDNPSCCRSQLGLT